MKRSCISFILFLTIMIASSNALLALESNGQVAMFTMDQVPYGYTNSKGIHRGVLYDILNEIIQHSQIGNSNVVVPSKRIFATMIAKRNSCALLANTPDISENFLLIEPIGYPLLSGVLPRAGIKIANYEQLKEKIIAVPLGIYFDEKFDKDENLLILKPSQYTHAIKMLKVKRVDAVAGAIPTLLFIGKKEGMNLSDFDKPLIFNKFEIMLVCTDDLHQLTRLKLQQSVIELRENGKFEKIKQRYLN